MAYKKTVYVPGTYYVIPPALLSYRDKYKAVGRNVFVQVKNLATLNELKADKRTLVQIAKLYPDMKFGQIVTKMCGGGLRKATDAELADYKERKFKCDEFIKAMKAREVSRREARVQADIQRAKKVLEKHGLSVTTTDTSTEPPTVG